MRSAVLSLTVALFAPFHASAAEPRWTMVQTDALTIIGDQSASTLRDVAIQLEQFRTVVAGLIHNANRPPALPTIVYVFGSRKAMQPYVPVTAGRPAAIAGFFQRDADLNAIVLSLEGFDESAMIAYHEYTHLLVGNAVRSVPVWLNEGLAEYYSTYRLADGAKEAEVGRPPEGRLALLRERTLPLADMIAVDHSSSLYNESNKRTIFYAKSWAVTHYLLTQTPNGGAAINQYAADVAEGRTPHDAFVHAFGESPSEFDRRMRVYVQRSLFGGTKFVFKDRLAVPQPGPARTLTDGEAAAWLGDLQRRIGRETEAAPRIDAAVMSDPDAAIAHLAAGTLRLSQQRTGEGLLELERASALAPDDFLTQYLHGAWLLRTGAAASAEQCEVASRALTRAVALKPGSSEAHAWLAYAQMQNDRTLADARASIERAIDLSPGRLDYRLRWADVRVLQGGYDDARKVLTALASMRGDSRVAEGAIQRLDTLAEFERRAARGRDRSGMRLVRAGEVRAFGVLTRIGCDPTGVRFHVATGERTIVTAAADLADVELISYRAEAQFTLTCGNRAQPEKVYVTWRPDAAASAERPGTTVAIEFLPANFVP